MTDKKLTTVFWAKRRANIVIKEIHEINTRLMGLKKNRFFKKNDKSIIADSLSTMLKMQEIVLTDISVLEEKSAELDRINKLKSIRCDVISLIDKEGSLGSTPELPTATAVRSYKLAKLQEKIVSELGDSSIELDISDIQSTLDAIESELLASEVR